MNNVLTLLTNGDEYEYKGTYVKGKNGLGRRFLLEHLADGEYHKKGEQELFYVKRHDLFGMEFIFVDMRLVKHVSATQLRFKSYNYYFLNDDPTALVVELRGYNRHRKLFHTETTGFFNSEYNPTFMFDGIYY